MRQARVAPVLLACVILCCCRVAVSSDHDAEQPPAGDAISFEREQIFVRFENDTTLSLMVEPEDTVQNLRDDLEEYEGAPFDMHLQLGDTKLENFNAQLSDLNIRAGATVTLILEEDRSRYATNFTVKTRDGRELPISTPLSGTVASLKNNITQWTEIPQAKQRLLLNGKQLKDERKLALYGIYNRTRVELVGPLEECRQTVTIFVRILSGATIEVDVDLADTANDLKEKIREKTGTPIGVQRLFKNERAITGEDHLCDLGLEGGSIVNMFLYSSRIASLEQVARVPEPPVNNPSKGPIFREVESESEPAHNGRRRRHVSIFKDTRNWVARRTPRPGYDFGLFDPIAYWAPNPDDEAWIQNYQRIYEGLSRANASESERVEAEILRARIKFSKAIRPYRAGLNLNPKKHGQYFGFTLGGGYTDATPEQLVPLGADFSNWAPDAFSDADLMRLFQVSERVRQVLARGDGTLCLASQKRINLAILMTYIEALAGYSKSDEDDQAKEGDLCAICADDMTAEPASRLPCQHNFHADCILSWVDNLYSQNRFPSCPVCRQRFMFPYALQGEAELATPELQDNQDD